MYNKTQVTRMLLHNAKDLRQFGDPTVLKKFIKQ